MPRLTSFVLAVVGVVEAARRGAKNRGGEAGVGGTSKSLWQDYTNSVNSFAKSSSRGLQSECVPQVHEATASYRGAIMLHHGFTACPQQFERLVPLLTSKGYTVYTPVNPGHGYKYTMEGNGNVSDYISDLPTEGEDYRVFARTMHQIMMAANGQKAVFGMSLGGGVAAVQGHLGGYDRRFLAAPMILASGFLNAAITLGNLHPWRRFQTTSWGAACESERQAGRAGICQFNAAIAAAARDLGKKHFDDAEEEGGKFEDGGMQIVFVDGDKAVSTKAIIELSIEYGMDKNSKMICGMPAEVGHSFLSPYDNPNEDKYWLEEMTRKVADYLTDGVSLYHGNGRAAEDYPRCQVLCKPGRC